MRSSALVLVQAWAKTIFGNMVLGTITDIAPTAHKESNAELIFITFNLQNLGP
jgi:hypothetical protein